MKWGISALAFAGACGSAKQEESAEASVALYGVYTTAGATDPTVIGELNFYDKAHVLATKAGCTGDACRVPGTYRLEGDEVVLQLDGSAEAMRLTLPPLGVRTTSLVPQADNPDIVSKAPMHLVTPANCFIVNQLKFGDRNYAQRSLTAHDFADAMVAQGGAGVEVPDRDELPWLTAKDRAVADTCRGLAGSAPAASAASYGAVDLVITRSCYDGDPMTAYQYRVWTRAGDEVTTISWDSSYPGGWRYDNPAQINRVLAQAGAACKDYTAKTASQSGG
jgi:hypothetical protein